MPPVHQEAVGGWHLREWLAEFLGTAALVFIAMSFAILVFHERSFMADLVTSGPLKLILLGGVIAAIVIAICVSPVGRLSGAHINPAVTLAFWITGHVHKHDLTGFWAAQFAGGIAGAGLLVVWGSASGAIEDGLIRPEVDVGAAIALEALMTGALVLAMFICLSSERSARWTPAAAAAVIWIDVWLGSPYTGAGLNPARTLGPSIIQGDYRYWWVYFVGAGLGAGVAALAWKVGPRVVLTAKLFHDHRYPSVLRSHLPVLKRNREVNVP